MSPSALHRRRLGGVALAALLLTPALGAPSLALAAEESWAGGGPSHGDLARGGFGGEGFRGGGVGGGGYHFGGAHPEAWRGGYQGGHPLYGPGVRPSYGDGAFPSRPAVNDATLNRDTLNRNTVNGNTFNRQVNVNNNFYNRSFNGWNRDWSNGGYWGSRPWNAGWYRWTPTSWGWWGSNAAAWGLAGLATGVAITSLVNAAAQQESPVILVPQTSYLLNYGSVEAVGQAGVSFFYTVNGTQLVGAANCEQGLLNGQIPSTGDQAQLLNAVCQVAYGAGS